MTSAPKPLSELRDELAEKRFDKDDTTDGSSCHYGFIIGWDACASAYEERIAGLVSALEFYAVTMHYNGFNKDVLIDGGLTARKALEAFGKGRES